MTDIAITFAIIGAMVVLFVSNRLPVAAVALCAALVLYATSSLSLPEALAGFGDNTVLFIASLFVVSASLNASGVTAWASQVLVRHAGNSRTRLLVLTMLLAVTLTAMIGSSGAVAALLPVLVLTCSLANVLLSNAAADQGLAAFGFFEMTVIGLPLLRATC